MFTARYTVGCQRILLPQNWAATSSSLETRDDRKSTSMRQNRTKRLTIRLTEREYSALVSAYKKTIYRQLAFYARKMILGKPVTVIYRDRSMDDFMHQLIKLRNDLNAVGNNFNQIVKKINSINDQNLTSIWLPYAQVLQKELIERIEAIQKRINDFSDKWL